LKGQPQGLEMVLDERWGKGFAATFKSDQGKSNRQQKLAKRLSEDKDFAEQPTLIEEVIMRHCPFDKVRFYPKFHCELSPIERHWCTQKCYCRKKCRGNLPGLRKIVPQSLDCVCGDLVRRHFALSRRYEMCYRVLEKDADIAKVVKLTRYTSHRGVRDQTGVLGQLEKLGVTSTDAFQGLCFCDKCSGVSHCVAPRCPEHGPDRGAGDEVAPRLPYHIPTRKRRKNTHSVYVMCTTPTCRKWREVNKKWVDKLQKKKKNNLFTCELAKCTHNHACGWCESTKCICVCDCCGVPMVDCVGEDDSI
jgi:hypothetical protein